MADQTVRTIYEARVEKAQAALGRLAKDTDKAADAADDLAKGLEKAGKAKIKPEIDVDIKAAEKNVRDLRATLEKLEAQDIDPDVDLDIAKAEKKKASLERELQLLARMDPSPKVDADTKKAAQQLADVEARLDALTSMKAEVVTTADVDQARADLAKAEAELDALNGQKAEMVVTVDADGTLDGLGDEAEAAGDDAGARAGEAIIDGLNSTPIVGALAGIGLAAGIALFKGIEAGLSANQIEDMFGARTGLDEATARKFGAAAGDAYMAAWGDSIDANMSTAQKALENGLIGGDSTQKEIQRTIEQLTAVSDILDEDVAGAAEAAGNMVKNGLAANAEEAFDIIVTGSQNGLNRSEDLLDTLREYSSMFQSLGLDGQEALGLVDQAMKAGARNSDVAADALKEFSIRAQDDSETTRKAFEDLGLDADLMGSKISQGGETAKEGLDLVLDGLRDIEDPMERNAAGVALFGTMWEDMGNGAGVLAMDLDNLGNAWINTGDNADSAMRRMSDNASTSLESVKRTVGNTLTQLAGGIASAWEEPLQDLAGWVLGNRETILQFMIDGSNAFFDFARAAVDFAATTIEALGSAAGAFDGIVDGIGKTVEAFGWLTGDMDMVAFGEDIQGAADKMGQFSEDAQGMADGLRDDLGGAIDDTQARMNSWTGPALLRASLDDAIYGMTARLDEFSAAVDNTGGTVTINGETVNAETALNTLISEVDASDGTVTINGKTVPADQALDTLLREVESSSGEITIKGNNKPANAATDEAKRKADGTTGTIDVKASTGSANSDINNAARDRNATIYVRAKQIGQSVYNIAGSIASSRADGGIVEGRSSGGMVPGPYPGPGVDNVLWPLNTGGQTLWQPLAGGEMVINPVSTAQWQPFLQAINGGLKPGQVTAARSSGPDIGAQVAAALSGWQPVVQIGEREMVGVMRRAQRGAMR